MIKAIETKYKGYRFRSRLEARWAVFFDAVGADWQYEPEGFRLPSGDWYLPDFRVKSGGESAWVEVKGGIYSLDEDGDQPNNFSGKSKTDEFADIIRRKGGAVFLIGDIPEADSPIDMRPQRNMFVFNKYPFWEKCYFVIEEFSSGASGLYFMKSQIVEGQKEKYGEINVRYWWPTEAYEKARSARFEHGETPQ